jgi:hypothetical protein
MQAKDERSIFRNDLIRQPAGLIGAFYLLVVGLTVFLICLPFMHSIFGLSDEGILLHGAERLLEGRRLYIDFFEILPPGGFLIMALWFGGTGISMWSARLLAILTIMGIACFTYLACRQASKHAPSSALVAIGWAVMSQGFWTQVSYNWFTTLFSMVAAWAVLASIEKPQQWQLRPLLAGLAAGAAAMVIPTRGALGMLAAAASFVDSRKTKLIAFALGSALIPICLLVYVIAQGAFVTAFDDVILFAATQHAPVASVPFAYLPDDQNRPLKYLFPFVALLTIIICVRDWRASLHDRLFRSCVAFCIAGFIGCFPRPDMAHIVFNAPLVCPLLTYCMNRVVASWPRMCRYAFVALLISLSIPSAAVLSSFAYYAALRGQLVETPRGLATVMNDEMWELPGLMARSLATVVNDEMWELPGLMARIAATPPSDGYFFYPFMPMLPFLTARKHVSNYDIFVPGYTTPSQYQEACTSALRHASWVVVDRNWTDPNFLRVVYPAMRGAKPRETKAFELALQNGFEVVARDGPFELRRRVKTVDETICAGIVD